MYRLLIVDDEQDVADALYDQFRSLKSLELDVYRAYSAEEALGVLDARKVDIVMTDMRMPGMSGLELLACVRERWPDCPVIFLTGYGEFDTLYTATRRGNVAYLLKTESPEAVAAAVEAAARQLDERLDRAALADRANAQMRDWLPVMQSDCLRALLDGEGGDEAARKAQFESLGIALDAERPVLLLAAWRPAESPSRDRARQELLVRAACAGCFSAHVRWAMAPAGKSCLIWLLQPEDGGADWESLRTQAKGSAEAIQTACAELMGLSLSFAVDGGPAAWGELPARCDALRRLLGFHAGRGRQQLLLEGGAPAPRGGEYRAVFRRVRALEECLEDGRRADFERMLPEIAGVVGEETAAFFRALAAETFAPRAAEEPSSAEAVVARVCRFIAAHLEEDLSLVRLADTVYFNPSYLSRVFKQVTGENVIERINGARVARARELLCSTRMKIRDIALKVGYDSPSYFTQFFKRETGLSPQEYRDSCHREADGG